MSRKKKHAEHVNHERWLVSWADFMTLLFALFTALYAISTVDQKKASSMAESARAAFSVDVNKQTARSADKKASGSAGKKRTADTSTAPESVDDKNEAIVNPRDEADPLAKARTMLQQALPKLKMHANIELKTTKTSIVVTLKDKAFFKQGSAKLLPGVLPVLDKIAEILLKSDLSIRVEGHTDDHPSTSKIFTSNWDLSAARAVSVVRYFAEEYSYPPENLGVAGYASGRPVASNETEEGRQANRRVDIILLAKPDRPKAPGSSPSPAVAPAAPGKESKEEKGVRASEQGPPAAAPAERAVSKPPRARAGSAKPDGQSKPAT